MATRILDLSAAPQRNDGLVQNKVELNYIYIHDDHLTVYTKQGNVLNFPINANRQLFIDRLEDAVKNRLEEG